MKRLYAIIAVAALFSSCVKEVVEPGMRISGTYAYDDGSGLSEQYISFEDGDFLNVNLSETLSYIDNSYWGYKKSYEYERIVKIPYSIQDGNLIVAGKVMGAIELKDDFLYFQGKKYSKVKSFNEELYSSITLPEGTTKTITYEPKEYSVPVTINRPIPAGVVVASTNDFWISEVKVQDGILTFKVSETKVDRDGTIVLKYTNADDVTLSVAQRPSTFIKLEENERTVSYVQSSQSLSYTIENPLPGSALAVSCTSNWVKNIVVGAESVTFDVEEHPGATPRTATLTCSYSGAADVSFALTQSYAVTAIVPSPTSQSCTYTGGDFSFNFTVENPRQGISVTATSQSSWITGVTISGNTVSYKVAENNSGASRTGRIRLAYGYYATTFFIVNQSGKPVQSLSLNKNSLALFSGTSETLVAAVTPTDAPLQWTSDNVLVATVNQLGVVSAVGIGTATITVNAENGKSASCSVTVYPPNLSANGSANCYIVSSAGAYSFRTTQGNSDTSVGSVSSVSVLWESFGTSTAPSKGDIIQSVSYAAGSGSSAGIITFSTPSTLRNGNAVIAAKDASGTILWSWHIWVCKDYDPAATAQTYYKNAGVMMDRNLGATSATPGNVGSLGLLYQWGRKDPFLGSSSISSNTQAKSTLSSWPSPVSSTSSNGTVVYAVKNPTTFIKGVTDSQNDWVYSSRDNTLWKSTKTIYDPCPPGWRVPDGDYNCVWSKAVGSNSSFSHTWNSTSKGMNFSGKFGSAGTIWYPAAGYLYLDGGSLRNVGYSGFWWSCSPSAFDASGLGLYDDGSVYPSTVVSSRAFGRSVRCLQE